MAADVVVPLEVAPGSGGLQLAARFRDRTVDDRPVAMALNARGIGAMALSPFHLGAPRPGLVFGIGGATPERVETLRAAVSASIAPRPTRGSSVPAPAGSRP